MAWFCGAAGLLGLAIALAGCSSSDQPSGAGIVSWLNHSAGAQRFTGQGEMGTGTTGDSSGNGGPSQDAGLPPAAGRGWAR